MPDEAAPRRRPLRYPGYDYSSPGAYFVTICVQERRSLFGEVVAGKMICTEPGKMVVSWWAETAAAFPEVDLDSSVVMPNHFHGILFIRDPLMNPGLQTPTSVGRVVQWFKTMTTNAYIQGVRERGWPAFHRRLWQRNYFERVIRTESELDQIQTYIEENPARWQEDEEYAIDQRFAPAEPSPLRGASKLRPRDQWDHIGLHAAACERTFDFDTLP